MNAYILCGGQSKRMGQDKALVTFLGSPMAVYIAQKLIEAGFTDVYAIVKQTLPIPIPQLVESSRRYHPLFGVSSALMHCPDSFCLITACDLPYISISTLQTLRKKRCFETAKSAAHRQPLLGIFPKALAMRALYYAEHSLSVMSFVEIGKEFDVPACELINVNTPQQLKEKR